MVRRPDDPAPVTERSAASARPTPPSSPTRAAAPAASGTPTVSGGIVPGPPRALVPDALRADRGGGRPVDLPDDLGARLDRARTRLADRRAQALAVPAPDDAPRTARRRVAGDRDDVAAEAGAAPDPAELAQRLDAARRRLDAPRRRRGGLGRD